MYIGYNDLFFFFTSVFCILQYKVFTYAKNKYNSFTIKQSAYILTYYSSICMFLLSCVSNYYLWKSDFNVEIYKLESDYINEITSVVSCSLFISFLIMDSIIGYFFYHDFMLVPSGYIHHLVFTMITCVIYKTNYYSILNLFIIDELPTIIFATGNINYKYRSDIIFGTAMFCIRIVYHGFLTFIYSSDMIVLILGSLSLSMYCMWFSNWIKRYGNNISLNFRKKKEQ